MTLADAIHGFFITRRRHLATTTKTNYQYAFRRLCNYFGEERDFASITAPELDGYEEHLRADGLSARSIYDNLSICSTLWTFAGNELGLAHEVSKITKPEYTDKQIVPLAEADIKAILKAAEWTTEWSTRKGKAVRSHRPTWRRDIALIMLLLDTGLRVTEACSLKIGDYQQESGRLLIRHGKGNKERTVFLGDTAQRTLWRYLMSRNRLKPADPIFVTRNNKSLHRTYTFHLLQRIGDNAGVANVHPHRFRHTFAIQFLRNGGNIFELQRILGHAELDTVKIYLNLAQVDIERAQKANSPADNWRL